jgi:hypothetical protein
MHFCFWNHLHLSAGLKVIDALQRSPCFSLKLRLSPLRLSPSLPPLLLCCTPPPSPSPEHRPAALRPSAACSTCRSVLPPTARSTRAGRPLLLHVGPKPERPPRRSDKHAGATHHSAPGRVISLSLILLPYS